MTVSKDFSKIEQLKRKEFGELCVTIVGGTEWKVTMRSSMSTSWYTVSMAVSL